MRMQRQRRGFTLVAVMIVLTVLAVTLSVTLKRSAQGLAEASRARTKELVLAAIDHGLGLALDRLQVMEATETSQLMDRFDYFEQPAASGVKPGYLGAPFAGPVLYPPAGMYANAMQVTVGVVTGQKTLAPEGEDASKSFGVVMDVQIEVTLNPAGTIFQTNQGEVMEQRAIIGVQIPHVVSHAGS